MKEWGIEAPSATGVARAFRTSVLIAALSAASMVSAAPDVAYLATDLPDVVPGEDLWSYDYTITGALGSFESINLLFSPGNYGAGLSVTYSDASLSALVTPPMSAPAADGLVSLTAIDPMATGALAKVGVQFAWLSGGAPGAQPFEVLDDQFNLVSTGMTSAVPEVSSAALLLSGLLPLLPLARRRSRC